MDGLTAQIVHEMFHVYQKICRVEAYPDDFKRMSYPGNMSYWTGTIYFLVKEQLGNMAQALTEASERGH